MLTNLPMLLSGLRRHIYIKNTMRRTSSGINAKTGDYVEDFIIFMACRPVCKEANCFVRKQTILSANVDNICWRYFLEIIGNSLLLDKLRQGNLLTQKIVINFQASRCDSKSTTGAIYNALYSIPSLGQKTLGLLEALRNVCWRC